MKKLSTLSKSIIMVLSIAGVSTAAIAVGQSAIASSQVSEAVAAAQSKVSLEQALVIAKKTVKGDVISADFDQRDFLAGSYLAGSNYEVNIVANNTEYEVKVDANSGKVLSNKQEKLDKEDIAEYNAMKNAKTSLNQAIKKANQSVNGKVIEAGFDIDFGKPVYEIEIVKGTQVHQVVIDSMTGNIIRSQVEAADSDD